MSAEDGIRRAIALYAQRHDGRDAKGFVALFTEDGIFRYPGGEFAGKETLQTFIDGFYAARPNRRTKHVFANSVIDVHGVEATAVTDVVVYEHEGDGAWRFSVVLRHRDRLAQRGSQWLFVEKDVELL